MVRTTVAALMGVALFAVPAHAQNYRADLGINGGYAWYSDMLDDDQLGIEGAEDFKFESGWLTGAQLTGWLTPRFGLRANFAFTERPLVLGSFDELDDDATTDVVPDVNLWSGSGDLMIRFANNARTAPYLALGVGAKWINPAGDHPVYTGGGEEKEGVAFFDSQSGEAFLLAEEKQLMGLAALGADFRLARNFGLRLEFGDRFWDAPLYRLEQTAPLAPFTLAEGDEDVGRVVHELYGTLGLHFLMGVEREIVAITPVPAPPPPPPAAPAESAITLCVIDPNHGTGFRTVQAIHIPSLGDTMVVVNGVRRPFHTTIGDVTVATEADWFVAGQPLTFRAGMDDIEFITYGGSRLISSNDLVYLGTVDGLPVYADRNDVSAFRMDIERELGTTSDFEVILGRNADLRTRLADVDVLYTPLQPVGCVFQPLQRQEEVRKSF